MVNFVDNWLLRVVRETKMFIGEYNLTLDAKGRISVPAKFRAILGSLAIITRGLDRSLFLYPKAEWEKIAVKLSQLPLAKANSRAFARLMLAGAFEAQLDKQGRVIIPEYLRTFASLTKKIIAAGLYSRIEIWDEEIWENYKTNTERESGAIAEALGELGI